MWRADVALVGFGHVARRFALLLDERRERLLRDHQLECRIVGIATARHGSAVCAAGIDPRRAAADRGAGRALGSAGTGFDVIRQLARSDAALRVMVETTTLTIEDGQPAISHVEAALEAGCHAITANKGPAAFAYRRLSDLARRNGVSFLFEGAVMDGVPIFNMVRETLPAVAVTGFRGIVNTTTQFILTALERGERFDAALARMQAEGIAEADPSLDLDGWDAAAKAAALANVLMDADLTPHSVERETVRPDAAEAARRAMAAGRRLRLIASGTITPRGVQTSVRLTELAEGEMLATLPGSANALVLTTDLLGDVAICQMQGDLTQTAYALLTDLIAVRRRAAAEARS
jgi:homoserine dehydrogenase